MSQRLLRYQQDCPTPPIPPLELRLLGCTMEDSPKFIGGFSFQENKKRPPEEDPEGGRS